MFFCAQGNRRYSMWRMLLLSHSVFIFFPSLNGFCSGLAGIDLCESGPSSLHARYKTCGIKLSGWFKIVSLIHCLGFFLFFLFC